MDIPVGKPPRHDLDALEVLLERAQQRAKLGWLPVPQEAATVFDALPDLIAAVKAAQEYRARSTVSVFSKMRAFRAGKKLDAALRPFYGTER